MTCCLFLWLTPPTFISVTSAGGRGLSLSLSITEVVNEGHGEDTSPLRLSLDVSDLRKTTNDQIKTGHIRWTSSKHWRCVCVSLSCVVGGNRETNQLEGGARLTVNHTSSINQLSAPSCGRESDLWRKPGAPVCCGTRPSEYWAADTCTFFRTRPELFSGFSSVGDDDDEDECYQDSKRH